MAALSPDRRRRALRAFLDRRQLSVNRFATAAGLSEGGIRDFLSGKSNSLTARTYSMLADAHKTTVAELMGEPASVVEIPLFGYAGAGDIVSVFDGEQAPVDYLPAPPDMEQPAAVIVRGDSMLPRFQDGDTIYFEQRTAPIERSLGRDCVVGLQDNRVFVKRLIKGSRRGRYHLVSINPSVPMLEDQSVAWAARIKWIQRRED